MTDCITDTNSINLTISSGELSADLIVSPADGIVPNGLVVEPDGVYVATDGWVPLPATLTALGGAVGNFNYYQPSIDLTTLLSPGQRIKFTQNASVHFFVVINVASNQLTLYSVDGSTLDTSAVTLPYFSTSDTPSGMVDVGPLVVVTADGVETLYWTGSQWIGRERGVWRSANNAAMTRSANTYANMTTAGYTSDEIPFRTYQALGFTWQFRWKGSFAYGAGQTSAGVRLTGTPVDIHSTGGAQDTTNIFAEDTSFAAAATRFQDSGWIALNGAIAVKDFLSIMPQFKSDGTRTVTVSQTDPFSVSARLVLT